MVKHKIFLSTFVFFFLSACCSQNIFASESEKNLGVSELKNKVKIIKPDDVSIRKMQKVALSIASTSPLFGAVAEAHLAVKLRDNGFNIVEGSKINELAQRELRKKELDALQEQLELEKQLGMEKERSKQITVIEKQIEQLRKEGDNSKRNLPNIMDIARQMGLDAMITGTIFEGRRQISFSENEIPTSMEKLIVATFHLQVVDVQTGKVVLAIIVEYDKGENIMNAVDSMTDYLKQEIKI